MQIANPIYDTVFKYLMNDSRIAKLLLSAIIGEKIVELDFASTEYVLKPDADKSLIDKTLEQLTVCRLDFNAKIETETGDYKTVIIELQKAKLATDIMRFRKYLGVMYQSSENTYDADKLKARQIYCIYFLNYDIGYSNNPVIKVATVVSDVTTNEILEEDSEFIKSLNHISWIVQVKQLKDRRRNELENLLAIFDQDTITNDNHILNIDETQYPEEYRVIIRKLIEACSNEEVRKSMQLEDEILTEIFIRDREIARQAEELTETKEELALEKERSAKKDEEMAKKDEIIAKLLAEMNNK
jgi:hypothetical protein